MWLAAVSPTVASFGAMLVLAALHVWSPQHKDWRDRPRSWLLTFASGVAVGFVLVRLIPSLFAPAPDAPGAPVGDRFLLSVLLFSVVAFFAVSRRVDRSRGGRQERGMAPRTGRSAFAVALSGYALMNVGVGYLVHEQAERGYIPLLLLLVAKGFAFLVLDHAFFEEQGEQYQQVGRWVVAAADVLGWIVGFTFPLPQVVADLVLALLGGAILLNTIKQETAGEHGARAWPFALGAAAYAGLAWTFG